MSRPKVRSDRFRHRKSPRVRPSIEALDTLLHRSEIRLPRPQLEQLWQYHALLRRFNEPDHDLTRIIGFESIVVKHYVDCLFVAKLVRLPPCLLDVGTGAGFPGIPLKIAHPDLRLILAEPRPRRVAFLKTVVGELGLGEVEIFEHKVTSRSFRRPVAGVITRALETIEKTVLRTSACTAAGSRLLFMKGPAVGAELERAMARFEGQVRLVLDRSYVLPGTTLERRLIVLERLTT